MNYMIQNNTPHFSDPIINKSVNSIYLERI